MLISRAVDSLPISASASWEERWGGFDQGLIACWFRGREMRREAPDLAERAKAGELPVLPWKGGVERAIKTKNKLGCLEYLAMWQGLRGDELKIDTELEPTLICARTAVQVRFTSDWRAVAAQASADASEAETQAQSGRAS